MSIELLRAAECVVDVIAAKRLRDDARRQRVSAASLVDDLWLVEVPSSPTYRAASTAAARALTDLSTMEAACVFAERRANAAIEVLLAHPPFSRTDAEAYLRERGYDDYSLLLGPLRSVIDAATAGAPAGVGDAGHSPARRIGKEQTDG